MNAISRLSKPERNVAQCDEMPTYDARAIVADSKQARIMLDGQSYFLRITRTGKLILTK